MGKKHYRIYTPEEESEKMTDLALKYVEKKPFLHIADLSCGTGNLLQSFFKRGVQACHLYGYDIDEEAICKAKETFPKESAQFYCEDSLYLDRENRFDVILGNPPYLGEKNHKEIFEKLRQTSFGEKYYEAKMDYLYFFLEKACDLLKENGILVYLTTNYWLRADGAKKLRKCLREEGDFLFFQDYNTSLFEGALGQHNVIFVWRKGKKNSKVCIQDKKGEFYMEQEALYQQVGKIFLWREETRKNLEYMKQVSNYCLGDLLEVKQGIVSGCDQAFVLQEYKQELQDYLQPFYKNKDIFSYEVKKQENLWILYVGEDARLTQELEAQLSPYRHLLEKRREVSLGKLDWWKLQWARDRKIFTSPKILGRQRCKGNWFAYSEENIFGSADLYYLIPKVFGLDLYYILAFLNSTSFAYWYSHCGKRKGELFEFYSTPLQEVPIYYPSLDERKKISILAKEQSQKYSAERQKEIDNFFQKILRNI